MTLTEHWNDNITLKSVSLDELEIMFQNEDVLLMDVWPVIEYEFGHVSGAISA